MNIRRFADLFPDLAARHMVPLWIDPARPRLPVKAYWLLEYYCDEPACDCRRVFLDVVADGFHSRVFASIHYGWETLEFYRPWDSAPRLDNARMLKRGVLDPVGFHCDWADVLLRHVRKEVLSDPKAVRRFIKHYEMAKRHQRKQAREELRARRFGSGEDCARPA